MTEVEIAWLAGFLEGEASFMFGKRERNKFKKQASWIRISVSSTDEDVIRKAALLMDSKVNGPRAPRSGLGKKPSWETVLGGWRAEDILKAILPYMGLRRSEKIKAALLHWENRTNHKYRRAIGSPALCHPDRKHRANGLCSECHDRAMRPKRREWHRVYARNRRRLIREGLLAAGLGEALPA